MRQAHILASKRFLNAFHPHQARGRSSFYSHRCRNTSTLSGHCAAHHIPGSGMGDFVSCHTASGHE